jgi:hypothetical protein
MISTATGLSMAFGRFESVERLGPPTTSQDRGYDRLEGRGLERIGRWHARFGRRGNHRGAAAAGSCDDRENEGASMIARAIRLLLASGFLAAVAHVAPVAERAALGITRVEDLAPEAIARALGKIQAACRIDRLSHRLESPSSPGTLPNPALTPGAVSRRTATPSARSD